MKKVVVTFNDTDYLLLKNVAKCMHISVSTLIHTMYDCVIESSFENAAKSFHFCDFLN